MFLNELYFFHTSYNYVLLFAHKKLLEKERRGKRANFHKSSALFIVAEYLVEKMVLGVKGVSHARKFLPSGIFVSCCCRANRLGAEVKLPYSATLRTLNTADRPLPAVTAIEPTLLNIHPRSNYGLQGTILINSSE